jgi:hypothetical protein
MSLSKSPLHRMVTAKGGGGHRLGNTARTGGPPGGSTFSPVTLEKSRMLSVTNYDKVSS